MSSQMLALFERLRSVWPNEKVEAIIDAKKVLDHTLKLDISQV